MRLRGTILLFLLAAGFIAWLLLQPQKRLQPDAPLFYADPNKISQITIKDGNDTRILKRNDNQWMIITSSPEHADAEGVSRLLAAICEVKPVDILTQRELKNQLSLSSLGLQNPKRLLTIHQEGINDQTLAFGNEAVGDKRFFARLNNKGDVFVIPSTLAEIAFRSNDDFRDHFLTTLQADNLEQIWLRQGLGEFRALFDNYHWEMTQPMKAPLNKQAVETWIEPLLRANIVARIENDSSNLSTYGFDHPRAEITLFEKRNSFPIVFSLGKSFLEKDHPDQKFVYLRCSESHFIFKVAADIEKIFMISPDALRNRQLFELNLDTVDQITISKGPATISFIRQQDAPDDWISNGIYGTIIPGKKMREMIDDLEKTIVLSFQPATSAHLTEAGLQEPSVLAARIRFIAHLSENTPDEQSGDYVVLQISFGLPKIPTSPTIFAYIGDTPDISEIPANVLELPLLNIGEEK